MKAPWVVILAGGAGTRFWPRSRRARPKPCLALLDDRSLLQATIDRITPLVPRMLVVTGVDMADAIRAAAPGLPADHFLVEPSPRNTAPALALALREVERRGGDGMIVLPSDHRIVDEAGFRDRIGAALAAAETGALVLLGVRPTGPRVGFGWIVPGAAIGPGLRQVTRFVEKPPPPVVDALLADGASWNAGIFVWTTKAFREALGACLPATLAAVEAEDWAATDTISVDHGVIERWGHRLVVEADVGWDDLGSWPAMEAVYPAAPGGVARETTVFAEGASGNIVDAPGRLVVLLGVEDLVIVEDGGVWMVAAKSALDRLPALAAKLPAGER